MYGALHPVARQMVAKLAGMVERKCPTEREGDQRQQVWRSISAAVVSRAAGQLARHAAVLSSLPAPSSAGCDTLGISSGASAHQPGAAASVWRMQADNEMADDSEQNDVEEILVCEDSTDPNDAQAGEFIAGQKEWVRMAPMMLSYLGENCGCLCSSRQGQ